jgi:hypothetical protein
MAWEIIVGLLTEGSTDTRFLRPVVEKTLNNIAWAECRGYIEVRVLPLDKEKAGLSFTEQVLAAAKSAYAQYSINILCIHADADGRSLEASYQNKIDPMLAALALKSADEYCKITLPIIPIQETEAWMLADTDLLKDEIGTTKPDHELGIHRSPEMVANPKEVIEEAIRIARQHLTKRRRYELSIADLYLPIGEKIDIEHLQKLPSFVNFQDNVRKAFRELGVY